MNILLRKKYELGTLFSTKHTQRWPSFLFIFSPNFINFFSYIGFFFPTSSVKYSQSLLIMDSRISLTGRTCPACSWLTYVNFPHREIDSSIITVKCSANTHLFNFISFPFYSLSFTLVENRFWPSSYFQDMLLNNFELRKAYERFSGKRFSRKYLSIELLNKNGSQSYSKSNTKSQIQSLIVWDIKLSINIFCLCC